MYLFRAMLQIFKMWFKLLNNIIYWNAVEIVKIVEEIMELVVETMKIVLDIVEMVVETMKIVVHIMKTVVEIMEIFKNF